MNLPPPLPEAIPVSPPGSSFQVTVHAYTAAQLRDYGAACYAAGMEAAAKVCVKFADDGHLGHLSVVADAIRAAMPPKP